jgi:ribosomal-protein-alanine N-acetyltransferase
MIVLETARLLFRDHEPGDLEPFCAMEADPEVRRYVGGQPRTRADAERKFRNVYLPAVRNRLGMWATVFKPDACYIGYCGLYPHFGDIGPIPGEGTLGFYLARAYWGRGLATETCLAFIDFGFRDHGLKRIVTSVEVGNDASLHVLWKLGFSEVSLETGERRSFYHLELRNPAS